ncbi:hypothetical protein HY024_01385 [Candidatus Curtissbacteria bacterium]|nr:hypothetical protein [Candidatus Curtissbacteria bacterium]
MKFFEGLRNLITHKDAASMPANPAQNDDAQEAGLRQNEAQIRSAIDGGYAVSADHTRLEAIKGHLANIEAKKAQQPVTAPTMENPATPTPIKNTIARRLDNISQLKTRKPAA